MRRPTIVHTLLELAQAQPDHPAYTFLDNGETETARWSFAELDRRARAIAAFVREAGARRGDRVLLVFPHHAGPAFVETYWGCLYAGVVPVPAVPPDEARLARTLPRVRQIAQDAQSTLALTSAEVLKALPRWTEIFPEVSSVRWFAVDGRSDVNAPFTPEPPAPAELCFLQYTSGSTSAPRGVMVKHAHLADNCDYIEKAWRLDPSSVSVSWCPVFHDMGLILGLLGPLCAGASTVHLSPLAFMIQPMRWLRAITRYRGTYAGGPNFAWDLCVRRLKPGDLEPLDLSSWSVGYCGAEPIRHRTVQAFIDTFAPRGFRPEAFRPAFGLAESVVLTSASQGEARLFWVDEAELEQYRFVERAPGDPRAKPLYSCGQILSQFGAEALIVDPENRTPCGPDQVGELWLRGPSVCAGYWNKPDVTAKTFGGTLASGEGPYLRTGDLGILRGQDWVLTGRLKDMIILLGRNLYPQDLELTAETSHPLLRKGCAAAFAVEVGDTERIALAIEVDKSVVEREPDPSLLQEMVKGIRRAVGEAHEAMLEAVVLLKPGTVPKTSSGKIQRAACRAGLVAQTLEGMLLVDRSPMSKGAPLR